MPINDSNFLMWFTAGDTEFNLPLPRPFVRETEIITPVVWLVPGDLVSLYINTTNNEAIAGNIELITQTGTSYLVVNTLATVDFPGGQHRYLTFIVPNVAEGLCRLVIGSIRSQWLWVSTAANAASKTVQVTFRNRQRLGGATNIRWSYLPDTFYQQVRIRLAMRGEEPETSKEVYTESTTGKTVSLYSQARQIVTFMAPEYNYWAHRAIASMLEHDSILINGRPYQYHTGYKSNMSQGDMLSDGEFALSDESSATINRN